MKIILLLIMLMPVYLYASTDAEIACQSAIVPMGKGIGYAEGYCHGTKYSSKVWRCVNKYTLSGKDDSYGLGACLQYNENTNKKTILINKDFFSCYEMEDMKELSENESVRNMAKVMANYGMKQKINCHIASKGRYILVNKFNYKAVFYKLMDANDTIFYVFEEDVE